ncbi:MAG: hypothetical protein SNH27_14100 [Rikenellaceae bacterium]
MTQVKDFLQNNTRVVLIVVSFVVTIYVQHVNNTARIEELSQRCISLDHKLEAQYEKIDAIKLDKAVFEATMTQFVSIQSELREMRSDIKELLKSIK